MSEISARLFQFDRTGLQQFPKFNYHKNPLEFLGLIIGLTAAGDEACGFDTSIVWKGTSRYMRNIDEKNGPFEYKLGGVITSLEFTGTGTFWWQANDIHGTSLTVEESWRFADQQSGEKLADLSRGLDGVGQVLAREESFNTSQFRVPGSAANTPVRPRVRSRIVFRVYANTIDNFKSREQFLNAFRDVVAGMPSIFTLFFLLVLMSALARPSKPVE